MRSRILLVAAFVIGAACEVVAQDGTAEGVTALARGDYQRAVEILKPIAENWRTDDPAAQFFMAGLYDSGRGVAADPLRACALYMRASFKHESPFGREANWMFAASVSRGGREFDEECQLLANTGFDNGFEPVTFDLGPGHFVEWTLAAATVTYAGRSNRVPNGLILRGARFLPLQHTELATGPMRTEKRHFIEMFVWHPTDATGQRWQLTWHVFEIVRDQVIRVDTPGTIASVDADAPPSRDSFDVREYAVLRIDDEGYAEWAVLKGLHPATQRIETESERREVRDETLARAAALKSVDWTREYNVRRSPEMRYVDSDRCGFSTLYGWSADRAEAVIVRANTPGLTTGVATFDLSRDSANVSVEARVFPAPQRAFSFCSDLVVPPDPTGPAPESWRAVAGTAAIELSPPGIRARTPTLRRVVVTLRDIVLKSTDDRTVRVAGPVHLTAIVGWAR